MRKLAEQTLKEDLSVTKKIRNARIVHKCCTVFFLRVPPHKFGKSEKHTPCAFTMSLFDAAVETAMEETTPSTTLKQHNSEDDEETAAPTFGEAKRSVKHKIKATNKSHEYEKEKVNTEQVGAIRNHFSTYSELCDKETMKNSSLLVENIMNNDVVFEEALVQISDMSVRLVDFFANMKAEPEHLQELMTHNAWKQLQKITSK
jgi:hypothetical protein